MTATFDFDLIGDQRDTTRTLDGDHDLPLGPTLGGAGVRVDAGDNQSVRAQLIGLAFEAEQVKRELIEADVPAAQALGRAQPLFLAVRASLQAMRATVADMPVQVSDRLWPVAQGLVSELAALWSHLEGGETTAALTALMHEIHARCRDLFGDNVQLSTDESYLIGKAEARSSVQALLELAAAEIAEAKVANAAVWRDDQELTGAIGLQPLAAATALLRKIHPEQRAELVPLVAALPASISALKRYQPRGKRLRELAARASDVLEALGLERIVDDDMVDVIKEEAQDAPRPGEAQAAAFARGAEMWREALRFQFRQQEIAVGEIESESKLTDPPKAAPLWQQLALSALKAATGGIAGLVVDVVADHVLGADEAIKSKPGAPQFKRVFKSALAGITSKVIELAFAATPAVSAGGGARGEASAGGGGRSTDPGVAFFASQKDALADAAHQGQVQAIEAITALRSTDAYLADPDAATAEVTSKAARVGAMGRDIQDIQRAETRAKYLAMMSSNVALADATGLEISGIFAPEVTFDDAVKGMVSIEFTPGDRPRDPVKVTSAWLKGANAAMRAQVRHMNLTKLGVPVRARGQIAKLHAPLEVQMATTAVVARNGGEYRAEGSLNAEDWLVAKGGGGSQEQAFAAAARKIIDEEIGSRSLAEHGIGELEG